MLQVEFSMTETEIVAESPCLGDCNHDEAGICLSCFVSASENDQWNHVSNKERLATLENARLRKLAHDEGRSMLGVESSKSD
jgi:predicted Fe-S protein YdhL (DUF1289 family)